MHPCIYISEYVQLLVSLLVGLLVSQSVGPSVTCFFGLSKNGGKRSKMTFHTSTGFLIRSVTLNLSFHIPHNLSFTILLSNLFLKSFFTISFTIIPLQFFIHNLSFTISLAQSLFHNLSFTIFLSQSFFQNFSHNFSFTIFPSQCFHHNLFLTIFLS